ncbi:MAG: glycosyltransferase family 39 protein [Bacteroidales bacterium]|nr:glycosyltransferase family 39 protein [Bacteroidales bacterium]
MNNKNLPQVYTIIVIVSIILLLPALLINLGLLRLIDDEGIRALVALEMKVKGEWITPTLSGELYFKKPPVFNWIILLFFTITGKFSEFYYRLPNIVFLLIYTFSIYFVIQKRYSRRLGFLAGMLFLVSARVLIYESIFALIDVTYSWLIFLSIIFIYNYYEKRQFLKLFLVSYTLTAITVLMKGIPSIAIQGITLLIIFIGNNNFRKLFSWKHLVGALPFFLIVGGYYYLYYLRNTESFPLLLGSLFSESADKSALGFNFSETIKQFFNNSAEVFYSFLPGTLIVFFLFKKKPLELIKKDSFLLYISRVFIFNILIFLFSPVVYMRYFLMLMPLLFILFVFYYEHHKQNNTIHVRILDFVFLIISIAIGAGVLVYPLIKQTGFVSYAWLKAIILFVAMGIVLVILIKQKQYRLELLIIMLLFFRIGFNFFVIPSRVHNHWEIRERENAIALSAATKDEKMYLYNTRINYSTLYYLTAARMDIIECTAEFDHPGYYIVFDPENTFADQTVYKFQIADRKKIMSVIKLD